jgi:hypothetical protein
MLNVHVKPIHGTVTDTTVPLAEFVAVADAATLYRLPGNKPVKDDPEVAVTR